MSMEVCIRKRLDGGFVLDVVFSSNGSLGILGASGSGKSMTLKCIAGIETPDAGRIVVKGRVLFDAKARINLKPQRRRVGYLFQNYALFPRMTVIENIRSGITGSNADGRAVVEKLIAEFHLEGLEDRYPAMISGGQQQRVALARMLAARPEIILLDEPFSALDTHLREKMQLLAWDLTKRFDDVLLVTHSRDEAYKLCATMAILDQGSILAIGETKVIFNQPKYERVARLTGCKNISPIRRTGEYRLYAEDWNIELATAQPITDAIRYVGIRAHDFSIQPEPNGEANTFVIANPRRIEEPFEHVVIFSNAGSGNDEANQVYWKYSKENNYGSIEKLYIAKERLLLLE